MKKYVLAIILSLVGIIALAETNSIPILVTFTNVPIFTNAPTIYTNFYTSAYALQNGLVSTTNVVK